MGKGLPAVQFMQRDDLRDRVNKILLDLHPAGTLPVPVEHLIEINLRIEIVPLPGLERNFDVCAYVSQDLSQIFVDENTYKNGKRRCRFSLAHELGHVCLHRYFYMAMKFDSIAEWKATMNGISDKAKGNLEWQANCFASFFLVPPSQLEKQLATTLQKVRDGGLDPRKLGPGEKTVVHGEIAIIFEVSQAVIERRLSDENFWVNAS